MPRNQTLNQTLNQTPDALLGVCEHQAPGYKPLVDFANWRVAVLNFGDELRVENIKRLQRHNETDEVFVLLKGRCLLFIGEGTDRVERVYGQDLQSGRLYNVRQGVWHNHTLSEDASVLVVENRDTTYNNSPFTDLTTDQQAMLRHLRDLAWTEKIA